MSTGDEIDTGFEDVLAGEVYVAPEPEQAEMKGGVEGHTPMRQIDTSTHPSSQPALGFPDLGSEIGMSPIEVTATVSTELTASGKDAAKALITLPQLTHSDLARLARDIAMDIKERYVVYKDHGLTLAQYEYLEKYNEFYRHALEAACIEWHAPLSTAERIKIEAQAILEDSLLDLGARMRNKSEGLPGVVEAAKFFGKIAGVGEREAGSTASGERFVINIDLGGDTKVIVSSGEAPEAASTVAIKSQIRQDPEAGRLIQALSEESEEQSPCGTLPEKPEGT